MNENPTQYCEFCGAPTAGDAQFCEECGKPLAPLPPVEIKDNAPRRAYRAAQPNRPAHIESSDSPRPVVTGASRKAAKSRSTSFFRQRLAWSLIFGLLLIPLVLYLIWQDVGEFNSDVWLSLLGFIVFTAILAYFTLRKAGKTWKGELEEIIERENGIQFVFRTDQGKRVSIIGGARLADYFAVGDRVVKIRGYDFPEKIERSGGQQLCVACGKIYPITEKRCRACRYPSIDPRNFA